jgi:uncharacterized protein DUF1573
VLLEWCRRSRAANVSPYVAIALAGAAACHSKHRPTSPHVACAEPDHDFGDVLQGDRLTNVFRLRNAGGAPLRIEGANRSYGCAGVNLPDGIGPGETADLEVVCDTDGRQGQFLDTIVLRTDDPLAPEFALRIHARVEPLLAFSERTVDLKVAFGETGSADAELAGRLAREARLEVESIDPPGPDVAVLPGEQGQPQGLRLTLHAVRVGRVAGQVVVTTGLKKPSELTLLYSCEVLGNISVDPTNPFIDLHAPGGGAVVLTVSSRRSDFRLDAAQVIEGPFEANFSRDDFSRSYGVHVRAVPSRIPPGQRGSLGRLRLISNDPAEPRKEVPLFALGGS